MTDGPLRPAVNALAEGYECTALRLADALDPAAIHIETHRFGPGDHALLDVLAPVGLPEQSRLPALVFLHGGGFTHGNRRWNHFMAPAIHACGAMLISVEYRLLAEGSSGPVQLDDVTRAMAWVRAHADALGVDADRLFVGGHSAGAALATAFAMRPDLRAQAGLPAAALRGVLCMSGSLNRWAITGTIGAGYALPDGPLPCDPDAPLSLLDGLHVPMLLSWGGTERQRARVERSSMTMISAMADRGVDCEWVFLEDSDHFGTHLALADVHGPLARRVAAWIARLS